MLLTSLIYRPLGIPSADRGTEFIYAVRSRRSALWLKMNAEETSVLGLDRDAEQ
jgi:hypothetical protein